MAKHGIHQIGTCSHRHRTSKMFTVLANRTYRHLFAAQIIALFGTGLMTVALALLAYDLAGENAGAVLGTALAIKMIVYVTLSPIAAGFASRFPRRALLVSLDLVRAGTAIALPFVDAVWQIYVLIAVLQSASAAFTPAFQATIPDILKDEHDYTNALSLSRMAYDLENLLSPAAAAVLIGLVGYHWLFSGTVAGFLISAALILTVTLPGLTAAGGTSPWQRISQGMRIYLQTPRLQGLLALNLTVAAAGAIVIVNSVVIVKGLLGGSDADLALAMAAFGGGSMVAAISLPRLLLRVSDRRVMLSGAFVLTCALLAFTAVLMSEPTQDLWPFVFGAWFIMGVASSAIMVPSGRLLRNSAHAEDRPMVFAAQFALSHGCWLVTYPLAGWLGTKAGLPVTMIAHAVLASCGALVALKLWPSTDSTILMHEHPELPADHPHLRDASGKRHAHTFVIDRLHANWPTERG